MAACEVVDKSECFQPMVSQFGQFINDRHDDIDSGLPIAQAKPVSIITRSSY